MIEIKKYTKKPVTIEAAHFDGTEEAVDLICKWTKGSKTPAYLNDGFFIIKTLEGCHTVSKGDFVIRGIAGEFYPCKPDIFAKTYFEADDS